MGARVLLVGAGAREHTIAWKLRQSRDVDAVFVAPGNAGTAIVAQNVAVQPKDIDGLVGLADRLDVEFYLATMDDPQPLGLVDRLKARGILCFGPTQAASQLEASKAFAKQFMAEEGIPTASARTFSAYPEARSYLESLPDGPIVVKASGLAAGKGAIVCNTCAEALDALDLIMVRRDFGAAGNEVVVEERMYGWEASCQAICDGNEAVLMPFACDYKRAQDGDRGLNTGGVGAYSPVTAIDADLTADVQKRIVEPVLRGMAARGTPFNGTLYPGLMLTAEGPRVVEFNARFGDPETQVVIPRLESDLFAICRAAAEGRLSSAEVRWSDRAAVGVVLASGGYPATYKIGYVIEGLDAVDEDVLVFHAGTKADDRGVVTSGGRVLTVVGMGDTIEAARERAYDNAARIRFVDMQYRRDIGLVAQREAP